MERAGLDDPEPDERLVDRVWRDNRRYVDRIRDDLRDAIREGSFKTLDDVAEWFRSNAYRADLMGQFLGKHGLEGGYARETVEKRPDVSFRWQLGEVKTRHCGDCFGRAGQVYTYDEHYAKAGSLSLNRCAAVDAPTARSR